MGDIRIAEQCCQRGNLQQRLGRSERQLDSFYSQTTFSLLISDIPSNLIDYLQTLDLLKALDSSEPTSSYQAWVADCLAWLSSTLRASGLVAVSDWKAHLLAQKPGCDRLSIPSGTNKCNSYFNLGSEPVRLSMPTAGDYLSLFIFPNETSIVITPNGCDHFLDNTTASVPSLLLVLSGAVHKPAR